jgi:hypothetical protein
MAIKILGNSAYTTITDFGNCSFLNTTGTFSKSDGVISVNITGIKSSGTSTTRGFYFAPGAARRMNYSMDIRFVSSEGASSATIPNFAWEQATARSITLTSEWQTFKGTFVRSKQESYNALTFYVNGTTFPLGTYYIKNIILERMPWIFTVNGKPLTITV